MFANRFTKQAMGFATIAILLAVSAAQAQAPEATRYVVRGAGAAQPENGDSGAFEVNVTKTTLGNRSVVRGAFWFQRLNRTDQRLITLRLVNTRNLIVSEDGKTARFGGAAVLGVRTPNRHGELRGSLVVVAHNNRPPRSEEGVPDSLSFRFEPEGQGEALEFQGRVVRGDLEINVISPRR